MSANTEPVVAEVLEELNVPVRRSRTAQRNDQMTLSECAEYDRVTGQKDKLTGWGIVSRDRRERGISRKERRKQKSS